MSTDTPETPEGFTKVAAPTQQSDYDTEWQDRPAFGEIVQGTLLAINPDCGDYDTTVLEIRLTEPTSDHDEGTLVSMWSTAGIDSALEENDVSRGSEIAVMGEDTFETDDGEERVSYAVYVAE